MTISQRFNRQWTVVMDFVVVYNVVYAMYMSYTQRWFWASAYGAIAIGFVLQEAKRSHDLGVEAASVKERV